MSYIICLVKTNRNFSELRVFINNYLTSPIGFIQCLYDDNSKLIPNQYYVAIIKHDLEGLHKYYEFDNYDEELDFEINEIYYENPQYNYLSITLPDYKSIIYKNQARKKLERLVQLNIIEKFNIRFSNDSCIVVFDSDFTCQQKSVVKTILHHTLWYDLPNKMYYICKTEWENSLKEKYDCIIKNPYIFTNPERNVILTPDNSSHEIMAI